ncbi:type VI secretion system baseplate subunit TssK [Pseudomonas aeruginosa]
MLDIAAAPPWRPSPESCWACSTSAAKALAGRVVASSAGGASEIADFLLLQLVNRAEALTGHLSRARRCTRGSCTANWWPWPAVLLPSPPASGVPRVPGVQPRRPGRQLRPGDARPAPERWRPVIDAKAIAIPIVEKAYGVRRSDAQHLA